MKKALYLVLKSTPNAFQTLETLRSRGFNGTLVNTESVRTAVDLFPEEHHFFTLRHFEKEEQLASILVILIVDDNRLEELKSLIRETTDNFKNIKGFMYTYDIPDYEGSI